MYQAGLPQEMSGSAAVDASSAPPKLGGRGAVRLLHYVYIDNIGVFGTCEEEVNGALSSVLSSVEGDGAPLS